jgi:hypothetical protein
VKVKPDGTTVMPESLTLPGLLITAVNVTVPAVLQKHGVSSKSMLWKGCYYCMIVAVTKRLPHEA